MAANGPLLYVKVQNTLVHEKKASLIFFGQKRNLEDFSSEKLNFQPQFKGGKGQIG
jgi:hypothetical protein